MKKNKITHIEGKGKLTSNTSIEITKGDNKKMVEAKKIILATGGRSSTFPGMKLDGKICLINHDN